MDCGVHPLSLIYQCMHIVHTRIGLQLDKLIVYPVDETLSHRIISFPDCIDIEQSVLVDRKHLPGLMEILPGQVLSYNRLSGTEKDYGKDKNDESAYFPTFFNQYSASFLDIFLPE